MRPYTLLIKPAGPDCNIACQYCFYSCKTCVFGQGKHRMTPEVQEKLVETYLAPGFPQSSMAFQGGEPTLMGLDFYKRLVELQQKYGKPGQVITNALQTNGTLLDDQWCQFLSEYKFLVGISLDGPKKYHDHYRKDGSGKGTFDRVLAGIESCKKNKVEFNILVLLNDVNVQHPDELFDFFTGMGIRFLQFVPCVEKVHGSDEIESFSITPKQYGDFMCRVFDRWLDHGKEKLSVRLFDSVLSYCLGMGHTECTFGPKCNDYIVIEHNGDAFCCDFFVEEQCKMGNIMETDISELAHGKIKRDFGKAKRQIANKCLVCKHLDMCRGGCPKDRKMAGGGKVESYFCEGYKIFFDHALPKLWEIAAKLRSQNPNG